MLVTGAIVLVGLVLRDLNMIAPLISMFFLITYAVINIVVLAESSLGLTSFRPTLRLPKLVPLCGTLGCIFAMFIVNPTFSLIAVGLVLTMYLWMLKSGMGRGGADDVRSGFFVAFAHWAATKVADLGIMHAARGWKPNLLVPVRDAATLRGEYRLLRALCHPEGSVKLLGIATRETVEDLSGRIDALAGSLRQAGVFTSDSVIDSTGFETGVVAGMQALGSAFFRPNLLFLDLPDGPAHQAELPSLLLEARRQRVGVIVCAMHHEAGSGREQVVNVWLDLSAQGSSIAEVLTEGNSHLALLLAYRLARAWEAELNIVGTISRAEDEASARAQVDEIRDLARIPATGRTHILVGEIEAVAHLSPQSDFDIIGLRAGDDLAFMNRMVEATRSSCMFTLDSGNENVLA
ncbi:hypothetical protein G6O69_38475 [Pseudenhygromyxa sp. WMMC2535]|nr:hypothetical protein [Pseudenhygromyxa sp. WMMC2535]